jgi:AcrR family transcriptional regulator
MIGADRRTAILEAATAVFAIEGYERAKTSQIAKAAKTTEAVMYRHFPSKLTLYRAVLRQLIRSQNEIFASLQSDHPGADALLDTFARYLRNCYAGAAAPNAHRMRILMMSLAHDGDFARLTYRRAVRMNFARLDAALQVARAEGDAVGEPISAHNAACFVEHVGAMMFAARIPQPPIITYDGEMDRVVRDGLYFCARGVGITEEAVLRYLKSRHR